MIIWIIYGFVFVQAIDSILHFITYIYYIGLSTIGISFKNLTFVIPILTFCSYIAVTIMLVKRIKYKSNENCIYLTDFPRNNFVILALVAMFLRPITYKMAGLYAEFSNIFENINHTDFISFYGWMTFGINISKWIMLIYLIFIYLNKYNNKELKY